MMILSVVFAAAPLAIGLIRGTQSGDWRMLGMAAAAFCASVVVVLAARSGVIRGWLVPLATFVAATLVAAVPRILYGASPAAVLAVSVAFGLSLAISTSLYGRSS
jgi:predicted membrane-bound dolichyl-phosphate-mannose-protein mannosyltransferase